MTKKMRVLVACEESQAVTKEFRRLGHEAYSCDIIECSGGYPEWHIMQDVLPLLSGNCEFMSMDCQNHYIDGKWDMIIAFPPCTDLTNSGARHFFQKRADGRQRKSIDFFCMFLTADCDHIVIENPVGIISGDYIPKHFPDLAEKYRLPRKPAQIIQPWQFAISDNDKTVKSTCLWLIGVPPLCLYTQKSLILNISNGLTKKQAVLSGKANGITTLGALVQKKGQMLQAKLSPVSPKPWQNSGEDDYDT